MKLDLKPTGIITVHFNTVLGNERKGGTGFFFNIVSVLVVKLLIGLSPACGIEVWVLLMVASCHTKGTV